MRLEVNELRAGSRVLLRDVRLEVTRDDRIHVAGPNGAGKTTLLEALVARASIPADRLLYLPQELSHDDGGALLDSVRRLPPKERGEVLSLVAALGLDPDHLLTSESPSPGEARKLKMAYGLGTRVWCLVLDEPTNHLDLPAIERLEAALSLYPGALVIVTHDDHLAATSTKSIWTLTDGAIVAG